MATFGLLNRIHTERSDGISELTTGWHAWLLGGAKKGGYFPPPAGTSKGLRVDTRIFLTIPAFSNGKSLKTLIN
jgi:hypothetical protein